MLIVIFDFNDFWTPVTLISHHFPTLSEVLRSRLSNNIAGPDKFLPWISARNILNCSAVEEPNFNFDDNSFRGGCDVNDSQQRSRERSQIRHCLQRLTQIRHCL